MGRTASGPRRRNTARDHDQAPQDNRSDVMMHGFPSTFLSGLFMNDGKYFLSCRFVDQLYTESPSATMPEYGYGSKLATP